MSKRVRKRKPPAKQPDRPAPDVARRCQPKRKKVQIVDVLLVAGIVIGAVLYAC